MDNFNLHMYTDIVFGKDAELMIGKKVKQHGGKCAMLVYGQGSVKRSGLYDRITACLKEEGIPFLDWGGVKTNPERSFAYEGIKAAKEKNVDFLLGIGGASAIDTAKGIALGIANDVDIWDTFYVKKLTPPRMAPVGAVSTISAAGSETSRSSVLRDTEKGVKLGFMLAPCRPVFALLNPELTYTLPAYQTAVGGADIFAHVLERYFQPGDSSIADGFCETLMRSLVQFVPVALQHPNDYQARAEIMLAASFGHNDITGMGHGDIKMDGTCHALERIIGGRFDTTHGEGLAIIMPAWLEYTAKQGHYAKQVQFARNVFGVPEGEPMTVAMEGIRRFRAWLKSLGIATTLKEIGVHHSDLHYFTEDPMFNNSATVGDYYPISGGDAEKIYESVLE